MSKVSILAGLLAAALVSAYLVTFERPDSASDDDVIVLAGDLDQLERVVWRSDEGEVREVRVLMREDGLGRYPWIEVDKEIPIEDAPADEESGEESDEQSAGDPEGAQGPDLPGADEAPGDGTGDGTSDPDVSGGDTEPEPDAADPVPTRSERLAFKGGRRADTLVGGYAPFTAMRELAGIDAERLAEFGLVGTTEQVEVVRRGQTLTLRLGEPYGTRHRYATDGSRVFIIDSAQIRPFSRAESDLQERRLLDWLKPDLDGLTVTAGEATPVQLRQGNRADRRNAYWGLAAEPGEIAEGAEDWVDRFLGLRATAWPAEAPAGLELRATVVARSDRDTIQVELLQAVDPQAPDGGAWYARSDFTRALVALDGTRAGEIIDELKEFAP